MKKYISLLILIIVYISATPNYAKLARIFNGRGGSGYFDVSGNLWLISVKLHTRTIGQIEIPVSPYLYLELFDKNGNKIKEEALQDSVENDYLFVTLKDEKVLIVARVTTNLNSFSDPTTGYIALFLLDNNGNILQSEKLLQVEYLNALLSRITGDYYGNAILQLNYIMKPVVSTIYITVEDGKMIFYENPQMIFEPPCNKELAARVYLKDYISFSCHLVDTADLVGKRGDLNARMENYRFAKDSIQITYYDIDLKQWNITRYHVPSSSFRNYKNLDDYPVDFYPTLDSMKPIYEIARLLNNNIIVTAFIKEKGMQIGYQMVFDFTGRYIKSNKTRIINPKNINDIPDGSNVFIKRKHLQWDKKERRDKYEIYIW